MREAGVRVMMVTGDHPSTARAIASEVGIATSPKCHVLTGSELRNMTPDLLSWTLDKHYEIGLTFILLQTALESSLTIFFIAQTKL